ncbi:MAG: DUF3164 family protein [Candidatus Malihini olakiniferum]
MQDLLVFGLELQVTKDLIDEYVTEWHEGSNNNLWALITDALQVDKAGGSSTHGAHSLCGAFKINNERWKKAMEAILESLLVAVLKTYIHFS